MQPIRRILAFASQNPTAVSVVSRSKTDLAQHTFAELVSRIADYASLFVRFEPGVRVALVFRQGFEGYAAILGAIHAGVVYCPLDPSLPAERLSYCIQQLGPKIVLAEAALQTVDLEGTELLVSEDVQHGARLPEGRGWDSRYIIFTSGSTGLPKGVEILSRAVDAFLEWAWSNYKIAVGERWAQFSSLGFDLSLVDILCCLPQGGTLVAFGADVDKLRPSRLIRRAGVNIWHSVPSVIPLLTEYGSVAADSLSPLRIATFCGEPLYPQQVQQLLSLNPGLSVFNTYGPTEGTLFCSCYAVNTESVRNHKATSLPIGESIPGWRFHFEAVSDSTLEELWIVSPYVGKGYIAATPDQDRFTTLVTDGRIERAYRTGDLFSRTDEDGPVFAHRNDRQVKVRGHRIDLAEIEFQALEFGFSEAKAVASQVGILLFAAPQGSREEDVRRHLSRTLPAHAVPTKLVLLDSLPHNINAKVDISELANFTRPCLGATAPE